MSTLGEQHLKLWVERLDDPSFVYVIQGDPDTPIKVGTAKDPLVRMRTLQTGNPQPLHLLYVVPGGVELEANFHFRLGWADGRISGGEEWFSYDDDAELLLLMIDGLARKMVESYDGSGKCPELPAFDRTRSPEAQKRLRRRIERGLIDGWSHDFVADKLGIPHREFELEVERMRASGDYYCFFQEADPVPRGPKPKSFVKLGHRHRYGGPMAIGRR